MFAPACGGHPPTLSSLRLWPGPGLCGFLSFPHPLSQIEKADLRDEGVYTCSATNLAGESKKDVTLKVLGEDRSSMGSKAWGDW